MGSAYMPLHVRVLGLLPVLLLQTPIETVVAVTFALAELDPVQPFTKVVVTWTGLPPPVTVTVTVLSVRKENPVGAVKVSVPAPTSPLLPSAKLGPVNAVPVLVPPLAEVVSSDMLLPPVAAVKVSTGLVANAESTKSAELKPPTVRTASIAIQRRRGRHAHSFRLRFWCLEWEGVIMSVHSRPVG